MAALAGVPLRRVRGAMMRWSASRTSPSAASHRAEFRPKSSRNNDSQKEQTVALFGVRRSLFHRGSFLSARTYPCKYLGEGMVPHPSHKWVEFRSSEVVSIV